MSRLSLLARCLAGFVVLVSAPSAVVSNPFTPAGALVRAEPRTELAEVLAGVQMTLDARAAAERSRNREAFLATFDPRQHARSLRGVAEQWFAYGSGGGAYRAVRATAMPGGYYKVWLQGGWSSEAVWVFTQLDGRWYLTEPPEADLGRRVVAESEHFTFRYYEWDTDVVDQMVATLERAYGRVSTLLDVSPSKAYVYLTPTYALAPALRDPKILAAAGQGYIHVHSFESYGAGFYDPAQGPAEAMYPTIVHEYTHIVNDQIVPWVRLPRWMSEGLAEYAANSFRSGEVAGALRSGRLPTLEQAHDIIFFTNEKRYTLSQISLAYGVSAYAVRWIAERWGMERFWVFARHYDRSRDLDAAAREAYNLGWADFQTEFEAWLRSQL